MYLLYRFYTHFSYRVIQARLEKTVIVDIDESYLYKKYRILTEAGGKVAKPLQPSPPLSGWRAINSNNSNTVVHHIPTVTSGKLYSISN